MYLIMRKSLLTLAVLLASTTLFASGRDTEIVKSYGPYLTNGLWDNW